MIKRLQNSRGFTLIELLIVIVIIGILAGVLIAVINPTQQQNRARDANVKATMNKVVLATQGYISAYGAAPDEAQFLASFQNAADSGGTSSPTCAAAGQYDCTFSVTGNALPLTCTSAWSGNGSAQCYFRYYRNNAGWTSTTDATRFRIYAKSYGVANTTFMYDNTVGALQHCSSTASLDSDISSCVTP